MFPYRLPIKNEANYSEMWNNATQTTFLEIEIEIENRKGKLKVKIEMQVCLFAYDVI